MTFEEVVRQERAPLVARLLRMTRDWDWAEDCVQEALVRAWRVWSRDGLPEAPGAWLLVTARNLVRDGWRRRSVEQGKLRLLAPAAQEDDTPADVLSLLFLCCHPALALDAQVALTLRSVAGLTTAEVARAFLVTEDTMTRRLTRARSKVIEAGIPFGVPEHPDRQGRLQGVLGVLYLLFNRGNDAGPADRDQALLATEAVRLARLLVSLCPQEAEPRGLLALLLLTAARRPARYTTDGFVPLEAQDRSLWDAGLIAEGLTLLTEALAAGDPGFYTLQAALAGCHARALRAEDTDYRQIAGLYARLEALAPSPVVRLNRAVAVGRVEGPGAGLALLQPLEAEPTLERYAPLAAAKADFLRRLGRWSEAATAYARAAELSEQGPQRQYLMDKRNQMREQTRR